jgi:hypothetical protein
VDFDIDEEYVFYANQAAAAGISLDEVLDFYYNEMSNQYWAEASADASTIYYGDY